MAIKAKSPVAETVFDPAQGGPVAVPGATAGAEGTAVGETAPRKRGVAKGTPRGPVLSWTDEQNKALVLALNTSRDTKAIVEQLKGSPAFANEQAEISVGKVRSHITVLRKAGVNLPQLNRGAGGRGKAINVAELNALIQPAQPTA